MGKAISAAKVTGDNQDVVLKINYGLKDAGTYPAILATYEITCSKGLTADQAKFVKSFLTYTAGEAGQGELTKLGYSPLPTDLAGRVRSSIDSLSAT